MSFLCLTIPKSRRSGHIFHCVYSIFISNRSIQCKWSSSAAAAFIQSHPLFHPAAGRDICSCFRHFTPYPTTPIFSSDCMILEIDFRDSQIQNSGLIQNFPTPAHINLEFDIFCVFWVKKSICAKYDSSAFRSYQKIDFSIFFPYECIRKSIWSFCRKVKPRIIIWIWSIGLESSMLYTKF